MSRHVRVAALLAILTGVVVGAFHAPQLLEDRAFLRVQGVQVEGTHRLDPYDVVEIMGLPGDLSILTDPAPYQERLGSHRLVRDATVRRTTSRTLVAEVEEREPVAYLPTPTLLPVDAGATLLPLDPAEAGLDLPILRPDGWDGAPVVGRDELPPPQKLTSELERVGQGAPDLTRQLSEVAWGEGDALLARLEDPPLTLHLPLGVDDVRLQEAAAALGDAMARTDTIPEAVDLRFDDQVVVRAPGEEGG